MARRKAATRARGKQGTPAWMWLLTGILIGLGLAWYLFAKGFIPQPEVQEVSAIQSAAEEADSEEIAPATGKEKKSRYDFFTVLPEMEVVVPEQELSEQTRPEAPVRANDDEKYILQVGSFKDRSDAEQRKAQLALLGEMAGIQTVTVNGTTWHRVRVGPVSGARQADEKRNRLAKQGIDSLVMKNPR
ncbi:MAG: SPOR domain-containing protein [Xanthomonadales bacterium]|nr:SPOR domain-containing protein [Xanthomonadales bacterium]